MPRGRTFKHSLTFRSYAGCTASIGPGGEIIQHCPTTPGTGLIGSIGGGGAVKSKPLPRRKPSPPPRQTGGGGSTSGGCIAAGGEILSGSDCRRLGIAPGTHSHTVTAQGRHIQGGPADVIGDTTKIPTQGGPSPTDAGCFAAGGEILTGATCDRFGIPRGTHSTTVTAEGTDVRTGQPIQMMGGLFALPPGGAQQLEGKSFGTIINDPKLREIFIAQIRQRVNDDQAFNKLIRFLLGKSGARLVSTLRVGYGALRGATTYTFTNPSGGAPFTVRFAPGVLDLGQSEVIGGLSGNPLAIIAKFFGTAPEPSALPGVGIGPILPIELQPGEMA